MHGSGSRLKLEGCITLGYALLPMSATPFPSFNGQCPSCHKRFSRDSSILRHMNNPHTSCMTWFDFLESLHSPIGHPSPNLHDESGPSEETTNDNEAADCSRTRYFEDTHPNVPHIFGSGPGFTDLLDSDPHAEKRRENLYFPFSSKVEWGLASWLLCSGLSMRAIDDFLSLPIVRPKNFSCLIRSEPKSRSNSSHSPSQAQKPYVAEWKTSPKHPHGRCKRSSSTVTRPRNLSLFSIATPLNAFKYSSETQPLRESGPLLLNESMKIPVDKTVSIVVG